MAQNIAENKTIGTTGEAMGTFCGVDFTIQEVEILESYPKYVTMILFKFLNLNKKMILASFGTDDKFSTAVKNMVDQFFVKVNGKYIFKCNWFVQREIGDGCYREGWYTQSFHMITPGYIKVYRTQPIYENELTLCSRYANERGERKVFVTFFKNKVEISDKSGPVLDANGNSTFNSLKDYIVSKNLKPLSPGKRTIETIRDFEIENLQTLEEIFDIIGYVDLGDRFEYGY